VSRPSKPIPPRRSRRGPDGREVPLGDEAAGLTVHVEPDGFELAGERYGVEDAAPWPIAVQLDQLEAWARETLGLPRSPERLPSAFDEMTPTQGRAVHIGNYAWVIELESEPHSQRWLAARVLRRALQVRAALEAREVA
jgi:hypothetical protein